MYACLRVVRITLLFRQEIRAGLRRRRRRRSIPSDFAVLIAAHKQRRSRTNWRASPAAAASAMFVRVVDFCSCSVLRLRVVQPIKVCCLLFGSDLRVQMMRSRPTSHQVLHSHPRPTSTPRAARTLISLPSAVNASVHICFCVFFVSQLCCDQHTSMVLSHRREALPAQHLVHYCFVLVLSLSSCRQWLLASSVTSIRSRIAALLGLPSHTTHTGGHSENGQAAWFPQPAALPDGQSRPVYVPGHCYRR